MIPDFPPWAVTIAAAHGESIREQTRHAPEVLAAAAKHLQTHQPNATIVTKTVDGVPKNEVQLHCGPTGSSSGPTDAAVASA